MITFSSTGYRYPDETEAISAIDLHIEQGEFVCILGGNGSGKSTLAKLVNALLVPTTGSVFTAGHDTSEPENAFAIREAAGMVFQNPDDQIIASIVEDDVAFGPENLGIPSNEIRRLVTQALETVGLAGFESHETHALSGGQKQRVALAGTLAMEPKILLLDEASSMLDPRGRNSLMRVCKQLNEQGVTIVMITHFMEEAAQADRIVVLDQGRIVRQGPARTVFEQPELLKSLNLEEPFAVRLSQRLKTLDPAFPLCLNDEELVETVASLQGKEAVKNSTREEFAVRAETERDEQCERFRALLSIQHVSFTYDPATAKRAKKNRSETIERPNWGRSSESIWALKDITLDVREGELLGIAGHTGSGKSTLIQHMNGLLRPTKGTVLFEGKPFRGKGCSDAVRAGVAILFQYPERQLFAETVRDDVAFGPRNLGIKGDSLDQVVDESLRRVGFDPHSIGKKSPFCLSGGQQRRVALAGVLAMKPRVLVLDEPAAGLDPRSQKELLSLIKELHESGLTIVMVSHSMDDLAELCDRVAVLDNGSLHAVGSPSTVFADEQSLNSIGLGVPSAQRIANELAKRKLTSPVRGVCDADALYSLIGGTIAPNEGR